MPTHDGAPTFANLKDSNVVWPLIVEKAFAQISGGCHNVKGDLADCFTFFQVVRLLFGCEPARTVVKAHEIDHVKTELRRYADSKCVVASHRAYDLVDTHADVVFGLRTVTINKKTTWSHLHARTLGQSVVARRLRIYISANGRRKPSSNALVMASFFFPSRTFACLVIDCKPVRRSLR